MSKHDPMEELFRDRAEKYDYPFEEKDWEALEARLDYEMPRKGGHFMGYLLVGLLLVSLPFWPWSIDSTPSTPQNWEEQTSPIEETNTPLTSTDDVKSETAIPAEANSEVNNTTDDKPSASDVTTTHVTSNPASQSKPQSTSTDRSNTSKHMDEIDDPSIPEVTPTANPTLVINNQTSQDEPEQNRDSPSETNGEMPSSSDSSDNVQVAGTDPIAADEYVLNNEEDSVEQGPERVYISDIMERMESPGVKLPEDGRKTWNFFVLAGVETGGTQLNRLTRFGWRGGLGVRYSPLSYLSINTGVNFSQLGYTAWGDEYDLQGYQLPYGDELAWTDGSCDMIEIPLEVRYHPYSWMNIGAGIRSYYVQQEEYDLYYESRYNDDYMYNYVNKPAAFSWVSHAVFSLGFNVPVYGRQLEIQPFYQMPLKGIGYGEVEWQSYGVSVLYLF